MTKESSMQFLRNLADRDFGRIVDSGERGIAAELPILYLTRETKDGFAEALGAASGLSITGGGNGVRVCLTYERDCDER